MAIVLETPECGELDRVVSVLGEWQVAASPMQLHPGDVGWFWRFGPDATASGLRTWSRNRQILAAGLLDGPQLLRLAIAPEAQHDDELARKLAGDVSRPERGVLRRGPASVEAPSGALVRELLAADGWVPGQPWSHLCRDLTARVGDPGVRIEVIVPGQAHLRAAVQRAAFERSTFTAEAWQAMSRGTPYANARCLVAFDNAAAAVAAVTVWSAGPGRPGLLEPMGVHRDHRGHGYGRAITTAAAAALQEMGSCSALVCTPSANVAAVATYMSAGFRLLAEVADLSRPSPVS